ncbi:MAG: phenylalanine--tRNA ligase subunit beta, partial [Alphaproteobacteria bacterium]|nr:phenylalanine--tRNA ligase subunit beta [Alphaproteobacteria bacterium]
PIEVRMEFAPGTEDACPLFIGRYLRGLRNGPSPRWLAERLTAIGLRPISTLVDITNLITYDLNRPLHVFDADKVKGHIRPRLARPGESLLALDGRSYELDPEICVIADDAGPEGLGGVMGGEHSGVTEETVNVFVEAALFDPVRTAATGRRLGINSDARYRFERGVDPDFVQTGMEIATRLMLELCGGEASELVIAGRAPEWRRTIPFDPAMTGRLGGLELPAAEQAAILARLGFGVTEAGQRFQVAVPPWRCDIDGPADFVEEVARVHGYDAIPSVPLPRLTQVPKPAVSAAQRRVRQARRALAARGLVECVTYSFMPGSEAALFGGGRPELRLANPIAADLDTMRPSILPNLLAAARRNMARGFADLALFEVGPQYADDTPDGQVMAASGIRTGMNAPRHWSERQRTVDAFDAKADALALLAAQGVATEGLQVTADAPGWYHPGRSGTLRMGPKMPLAHFGEVHPLVLSELDVRGPVVGFELVLERLPQQKARAGRTRPPLQASDFQAVERDFAFLLDEAVPAEQVVRAARGVDRNLIAEVSLFDLYAGKGLPEGKKSLALSVRLEPKDRTLTEKEIEAVAARIVAAVAKQTGGTLRG